MDVDFGTIHVAAGRSRQSPPPGALALSAPRRSARGRSHDVFFVNLGPELGEADEVARAAAGAFYGTPGSVTAALRQAAVTVNQLLLDQKSQAAFVAGALRQRDLYLAQCGPGQAILLRSGTVSRITPEASSSRPLGSSLAPMVQFRHFEVQPADIVLTCNSTADLWPDTVLSGLVGLSLDHVLDRLGASATQDLQGLALRVPGSAPQPSRTSEPAAASSAPQARSSIRPPSAVPAEQPGAYAFPKTLSRQSRWLRQRWTRLQETIGRAWTAFVEVMLRLAPGLLEAPRPGEFSPNVLAFTAAAVPILVVGLSTLIYFSSGRGEQFDAYLAQAEAAMVSASLAEDPQAARPDWVLASQWLDLAESYKQTDESADLRAQVQGALDELDLVHRLEFVPTVSGGFGPQSEITALAATATDLYAYDRSGETIWHAWSTGRGYEIDSQFDCLAGRNSIPDFGSPVSIVVQPEPGALGAEGVVALDADGTVLYCAPGVQPLISQLVAPNVGWGELRAMAVYGGDLYVLDPGKNTVWIYDASDGLFSGSPALYFVEDVPALGTAIDLALAQDELIILYADGGIDRCRRLVENTTSGTLRIRVECELEPSFQDERPGQPPRATFPGASPAQVVYSPPPEPSLFLLDSGEGTVYHYSMRLVYQGQYPTAFDAPVSAITQGPPNSLYVAAGEQVYVAQLGR